MIRTIRNELGPGLVVTAPARDRVLMWLVLAVGVLMLLSTGRPAPEPLPEAARIVVFVGFPGFAVFGISWRKVVVREGYLRERTLTWHRYDLPRDVEVVQDGKRVSLCDATGKQLFQFHTFLQHAQLGTVLREFLLDRCQDRQPRCV